VRVCKAIDAQADGPVFALYLKRTAKDFEQRRMPYFSLVRWVSSRDEDVMAGGRPLAFPMNARVSHQL
jgi:hypothetical protein